MNTEAPYHKKIALFCLTPGGKLLAEKLHPLLPVCCFTSEKLASSHFLSFGDHFATALQQAFRDYDALIVIAATGIVVRSLAPVLKDKMTDPAVIVMDEKGQHVISLLSGHMGGANQLANWIASRIGGQAVITTATDVNQLTSFDLLAKRLNATFSDFRQTVKILNQRIVCGERIGIWWHPDSVHERENHPTPGLIQLDSLQALPELDALVCVSFQKQQVQTTLPVYWLIPKRIVAGIGCRKDTSPALLLALFSKHLEKHHFFAQSINAIGSITLKAEEPALLSLAAHFHVPFNVFSTEELAPIAQQFPSSAFVEQTIGIGCVSQPVAWLMSKGNLVGETLKEQGITITLGVTN